MEEVLHLPKKVSVHSYLGRELMTKLTFLKTGISHLTEWVLLSLQGHIKPSYVSCNMYQISKRARSDYVTYSTTFILKKKPQPITNEVKISRTVHSIFLCV